MKKLLVSTNNHFCCKKYMPFILLKSIFLFFLTISSFCLLKESFGENLLKNGDFETGNTSGWICWETFPWDGDGIPVKHPARVDIHVPGTIGVPTPPVISGLYALTQEVTAEGTARGGIYQELNVNAHSTYVLTGSMAFYGDNIGDITIIGLLDGQWNPVNTSTTPFKFYIGGDTVSSWTKFSLSIIPSKNIITVFTETCQDWGYGYVAGWYDNLSLQFVYENSKPFSSEKTPPEVQK
ncbi:hypothetical protein [uncultured Candidatus Kuenenia sp.]|jgi:hypothetical protein|uniref:hypothetical protein n=1 Tax=uncultured Candidatus Kuenenia sp. TaxID=1048336 RepID=UPI00030A88E6|nr:hypothetical protein [uncultured Candidatus Kuenenia sp.]TVL98785.1 MAG: hypothetical protein CV080_08945 [Candidatus Kuenenia stuttgartiensis]